MASREPPPVGGQAEGLPWRRALYCPGSSFPRVNDEPEGESGVLEFEQCEDGIENIKQHSRSPSRVDHFPERLRTVAVVVHFDMSELTEEILERIPGEAVVVLGVGMITVEKSCGGDAHPAWFQHSEDSIESPLRIVQVFKNLDCNDRIERIGLPLE